MKLTNLKIQNAKPKLTKKRIKLYDGKGLVLCINKAGTKTWYKDYKFEGKRQSLMLGHYPTLTLAKARELNQEISHLLSKGLNPKLKDINSLTFDVNGYSLRDLFEDYKKFKAKSYGGNKPDWSSVKTIKTHTERLENYVFPVLGDVPIAKITAKDLKNILLKVQDHGTLENLRKIKTVLRGMFDFAVGREYIEENIVLHIPETIFVKHVKSNYKHVTTGYELKAVLTSIRQMSNLTHVVHKALEIGLHLFLRPKELTSLEWSFVDLNREIISIPGQVMKNGRDHIVPLSSQVIRMLRDLKALTGHQRYVFESSTHSNKPISPDALAASLRRHNIREINPHGFRHTASTILNERNHHAEAIELQLNHTIPGVRGVYNKALKIDKRIKLMQDWSNYLEKIPELDDEQLVTY